MISTLSSHIKNLVLRRKRKSGQTLVEYALILAFISVVAIAVLRSLGTTVSTVFKKINTNLQQATGGS
ncbi:MAG: Flp family type IVb pilin [Candidatus Methylacidiphilales bacterium]